MENLNQSPENTPNPPIEYDYEAHKENPGPAEEAVTEKNDESAGNTMRWIIPALVAAMLLIYIFFFRT